MSLAVAVPLALAAVLTAAAQESSSSSGTAPQQPQERAADAQALPTARARAVGLEEGGAAVTLETNEALFQLAAGLNACGYDADLDHSEPVRRQVRTEMQQALLESEPARDSRDKLCEYIAGHRLSDSARDVGQYISLALYLAPPPELTPSADLTELPPDAAAVVNVLGLVRTFAEQVQLHALWVRHRAEYEALTAQVHDPMTRTILDSNIYLHQPVSTYDSRRFLVLLEPMLSPLLTHARIYASDYIVVMSPSPEQKQAVRLDLIRHTYLHYVVEPMVYSRAAALERLQPLLRPVQDAPLEFQYKSDINALMAECLIKAIEARTFEIAQPRPQKPKGVRTRSETEQYDAALAAYNQLTEIERRKLVEQDVRQGWTLAAYLFEKLQLMERTGDGLRDEIGPMIYGMDVERERHHDEQIVFAKEGSADVLRGAARQPQRLKAMDRAEMALMKGDRDTAQQIAEKEAADPHGDHGRAQYTLARIELMQGDPQGAMRDFESVLKTSTDPRTLAWSHIYLGRLYDSMHEPERDKAVAEYKAALAVRDARPDTRLAAENGIKRPFAMPQRERKPEPDDDRDLDPTGKAQKDAYRPAPPK